MMKSEIHNQAEAIATFGSGCFWCTEAVYLSLSGVIKVVSGYAGGEVANPTYREVCTGQTGHAEVVQVHFDPAQVSYQTLLKAFFFSHDPTTLNRQGNDVGSQYRSVIYYHNDAQQVEAEKVVRLLSEGEVYDDKIVTEISPFKNFYPAEVEHQDYFALHSGEPYCRLVIQPKVQKFRQAFVTQLATSVSQ